MTEIRKIIQKIKKFREARNWKQFHDPKNMAISIIIEAAELLEHFQWKNKKEVENHCRKAHNDIEEEIADVALYLFELADNLGIDITKAMEKKLNKNSKRYPIKKARGKHLKYDKL
jgi:NTP pyrophosphatase (non-canonical NTP hydrolase)